MRARIAGLILAASVTLGGCAYGGLGLGYGDGYGYGYDPYYGYGYGSPYGYGYGSPYGYYGGYYGSPYGWYNGYYYPGTGYYVYDSDRHRRVMTDAERQHWREVFSRLSGKSGTTATTTRVVQRENWSGFNRVRTRSSDSNTGGHSWRHSTDTSSSDSTISSTSTSSGRHGHHRRGDD
jgi:hypothetical protein